MTTAVPSLDAVLEAGGTVVVPGIARWLGVPQPAADEPEDTYEAYLERISQKTTHTHGGSQ